MSQNASALHGLGIGAYADTDPWTLPSATLADLAALSTITPGPASISGGKLLSAIQSYLSSVAPNHCMDVEPDGTIRFLDMRAANITEYVLTLDEDPISPTPLRRSVADCYQRVVVRGMPIAEPQLVSLSNGGLVEDFAWGSYDNDGAKAAWTYEDFRRDEDARSVGTCECSDTVTVVVTSDPSAQVWGEDEWDQTHRMGSILLSSSVATGISQNAYKRIVSNTAKTSGGTSTLTLESALPATNYDTYAIYGISSGASLVWRKYKIVDDDVAAALARQFSYPFAWALASGGAATVTSFPVASVLWSDTGGGPPYNEVPIPFSVVDRYIIFAVPTYQLTAGAVPADVRVVLAVNTGELTATKPASGYEGTSHTVEGLEKTLTITSRDWRDPINQSHVEDYAQDVLDSVKNTIVEGTVTYNGLYSPALTWQNGLSITGDGYVTGWKDLNLPITEVEITWNSLEPFSHTTTMQVSNRRASLTSSNYLRPSRVPGGPPLGSQSSGQQGNQEMFSPEAYEQRAKAREAGRPSDD
jgi:hypothetical protein